VTIDLQSFKESINELNILNLQGQSIAIFTDIKSKDLVQLSLIGYPSDIYFIQVQSPNGVLTKKTNPRKMKMLLTFLFFSIAGYHT
jgi:hypothetical protein